jgi:hypothetical protein
MSVFKNKLIDGTISGISISLKVISAILILPILITQCVFKFMSSMLKWMSNKIEKLFEHKAGEGKFKNFVKNSGDFILGFIPRILQYCCNLINCILDLPESLIKNSARIFDSANDNFFDFLSLESNWKSFVKNPDIKISLYLDNKMESFDQKINPRLDATGMKLLNIGIKSRLA